MATLPLKPVQAIAYAILIWVLGFAWGSIVFMTPKLKGVSAIPFISSNPAISFPILLLWTALTPLIARRYLRTAPDKSAEGFKVGVTLATINLALDLLVLVFLLRAGFGYFASATVWFAYATLVLIPWITGKTLERN